MKKDINVFITQRNKNPYPYRKFIHSENDVYLHICFLVENSIKTIEELKGFNYTKLKNEYFLNSTNEQLDNGFYNYFIKIKK